MYTAYDRGCTDPECGCGYYYIIIRKLNTGVVWKSSTSYSNSWTAVYSLDKDGDQKYIEEEIDPLRKSFLEALEKYPCDNVDIEEIKNSNCVWDWIK